MSLRSIIKKKLVKVEKTPIYIPLIYGSLLNKKNILISGGAGGIGQAIAEACLRNGANVVILGRNVEKLERASKKLIADTACSEDSVGMVQMDVSNVDEIKKAIEEAVGRTTDNRIDVLVNNAGTQVGKSIGETDEADYNLVLNTNLKGSYFMCQEFANYLIANNIQGNILNISSVSGIRPAISPYMVSKAALNSLTKGLAKKLIKYGIVVNGIAPGPTATEMLKLDGSDLMYEKSPAGRYATAAEVANLAAFLISDMARMVIGETITISGGCGNLTVDDVKYI